MAEWRALRGWSSSELESRLQVLASAGRNFDANEIDMTGDRGWDHYHSDAVITRVGDDDHFARARVALANYQFSDPAIVVGHCDPDSQLLGRTLLLEIKVLGLRYLCPTRVNAVRDEPDVFGFRYDTLDGHIERGMEWFLLTRTAQDIRFRIEARWKRGDLPNWWSQVGFALLADRYQRTWHRQAHRRMSLWSYFGSAMRPSADSAGLTHQGVDVVFTYHTRQR